MARTEDRDVPGASTSIKRTFADYNHKYCIVYQRGSPIWKIASKIQCLEEKRARIRPRPSR